MYELLIRGRTTRPDIKARLRMKRIRIGIALLGLVTALFGSRLIPVFYGSNNVLVWVNQQPITTEQLAFAEQRLVGNSGRRLTETERDSIVQLLIDEELLLQRAQSTGTLGNDPGVRKAIVQAVIDKTVADFQSQPIDSQQLKHFHREHRSVFARPARVAIEVLRFETYDSAEQALTAVAAGARFDLAGRARATKPVAALPASPLPAHMLRRYLGNTLTEVALNLEQGRVSDPVVRPDGVYLLKAHTVLKPEIQAFEEVQEKVAAEYEFRGRETALANVVARLWTQADININSRVAPAYRVPEKYTRDLYSLVGVSKTRPGGEF